MEWLKSRNQEGSESTKETLETVAPEAPKEEFPPLSKPPTLLTMQSQEEPATLPEEQHTAEPQTKKSLFYHNFVQYKCPRLFLKDDGRPTNCQRKLEKKERMEDKMKCFTLKEKIDLQVAVARLSSYDVELVQLRQIMSTDARCPVKADCIDIMDLSDLTLEQLRLYVESQRIKYSTSSDSLMPLEKKAPPDTPNLANYSNAAEIRAEEAVHECSISSSVMEISQCENKEFTREAPLPASSQEQFTVEAVSFKTPSPSPEEISPLKLEMTVDPQASQPDSAHNQ
ncbi:Hypothetical predicted protein [Cloeon dipterum]|uniref:Uncharacterized protein n=1 Tax=Cloeon dipterum TaxID=197152 RepID=A0A8S1DYA5_9INSE|nr:Hypothetical predicted protein [Cloeon dipterum]